MSVGAGASTHNPEVGVGDGVGIDEERDMFIGSLGVLYFPSCEL